MRANISKEDWDAYQKRELATFEPLFARLNIVLDEKQLHTGGERYLMSGKKLVLTGTRKSDGERVVVKVSSDASGRTEIRREKEAHDLLRSLAFANDTLLSPEELHFEDTKHGTLLVTAFIEQPNVFFARPLQEQFFLALRALEAQEGFHATTYEHEQRIKKTFPVLRSDEYLKELEGFIQEIEVLRSDDTQLRTLLKRARVFLTEHSDTIDRYSPYLTHTDLAPHNMRVSDRGIFLLDYAAFHFGNKYEGWARFLNYMLIHNPELENLLAEHVRTTRGPDEYLSLRLMRVYKTAFLLEYYAKSLAHTTGDLRTLTEARIAFWTGVLSALLDGTPIAREVVASYASTRNALRTKEETARQKEFNLV
ncbi:MAG: hypothetical protein WCT45_03455 [Candidatus Paceibacterota bacterium]|jgi:hypothetical protein